MRKNNKYTNEFKKKVIDEYLTGNESFYSLERKYNISNSTIKNWYYNFYKKILSSQLEIYYRNEENTDWIHLICLLLSLIGRPTGQRHGTTEI